MLAKSLLRGCFVKAFLQAGGATNVASDPGTRKAARLQDSRFRVWGQVGPVLETHCKKGLGVQRLGHCQAAAGQLPRRMRDISQWPEIDKL